MRNLTKTEFDEAIEKNRLDLVEMVLALFGLLGFAAENAPEKISKEMKSVKS